VRFDDFNRKFLTGLPMHTKYHLSESTFSQLLNQVKFSETRVGIEFLTCI
jgi:hypothetical protein